jgi:hypothetical protein
VNHVWVAAAATRTRPATRPTSTSWSGTCLSSLHRVAYFNSCSVNPGWAAAATTTSTSLKTFSAFPCLRAAERKVESESRTRQDRKGDRQGQPGVERGCLRGEGAMPWNTSTSQNLQRDTMYEGRCEVSGKRTKWKTLVQCEPRSGGGCNNNDYNESKPPARQPV